MHEQEAFRHLRPNSARTNYAAAVINLKVAYVPTHTFGSFCQPHSHTAQLTTLHPACVKTQKSKLARLRAAVAVWEEGVKGRGEGEEGRRLEEMVDPFSHPHRMIVLTSMLRGQKEHLALFTQRLEKLRGKMKWR